MNAGTETYLICLKAKRNGIDVILGGSLYHVLAVGSGNRTDLSADCGETGIGGVIVPEPVFRRFNGSLFPTYC